MTMLPNRLISDSGVEFARFLDDGDDFDSFEESLESNEWNDRKFSKSRNQTQKSRERSC